MGFAQLNRDMRYIGKLYGKSAIGYFDTGYTTEDWDKMEEQVKSQPEFMPQEEMKVLDELMTYLLDELLSEVEDRELAREGIIAYTEAWHKYQVKAANKLKGQ